MGAHCKEVTAVLEDTVEVAEVEADGRKEYFDLESMTEETARRVMIGLERVPYYELTNSDCSRSVYLWTNSEPWSKAFSDVVCRVDMLQHPSIVVSQYRRLNGTSNDCRYKPVFKTF